MGTFATLLQEEGAGVPEEKREEFRNNIEKLFQAGGMMEMELVQMCGRKAVTIRKASMHDDGMDFHYNYFEDDCWEDAGFSSRNGTVWSGKIGWREFHLVIVAAYVLESLYTDGAAVAMVDGDFVISQIYTGWINSLFQKQFSKKNNDPWVLFETLHDQGSTAPDRYDWNELITDLYGLIGYYDIKAVTEGTAAVEKEFDVLIGQDEQDEEDDRMNYFDFVRKLKTAIKKFHEESELSEEEQLSSMIEMLRSYYEQDSMSIAVSKKYGDKHLETICFFAALADAPPYVFQVISETYDVDFWELWEQARDVARRKRLLYDQEIQQNTISVPTKDFLRVRSDDLLLFGEGDTDIPFSQKLKDWFSDLKDRFETIMKSGYAVDNPLYWILDLMQYADENYYRVYTFSDFFQDSIEHLQDRRFLALWKIYDDMLHDPVMEEAGNVIFVPEGPEYEHAGLSYFGTPPRRRLKTYWDVMKKEDRDNEARITFRRYMALLGNRKLRNEVFGV